MMEILVTSKKHKIDIFTKGIVSISKLDCIHSGYITFPVDFYYE